MKRDRVILTCGFFVAIATLLFLLVRQAIAGPVSPCFWSGTTAKCLPTDGVLAPKHKFYESAGTTGDILSLVAPALAADITVTLPATTGTLAAVPSAGVVYSTGSVISSNTVTAGGIIYGSATDVVSSTGAGTASQWTLSGGTGIPTFSDDTTRVKSISADGVILTGKHTTTSSFSSVDFYESSTQYATVKSLGSANAGTGGNKALQVWNFQNAPLVFGTNDTEVGRFAAAGAFSATATATNDSASSTQIGYIKDPTSKTRTNSTSVSSATQGNVTASAMNLGAGDWLIEGIVCYTPSAATLDVAQVAISKTTATLPGADTLGVPTSGELRINSAFGMTATTSSDTCVQIVPYRASLSTATDFFLVSSIVFTAGTVKVYGSMWAYHPR